ncbi:hypothetical protein Trydic_g9276 [Trypoxylus dichotomus]
MGSMLSPGVANIFIESFESVALENSELKPKARFRFVDDTFIIWPHGRGTLDSFLGHLNSQHPGIKFTTEVEKNGVIPYPRTETIGYVPRSNRQPPPSLRLQPQSQFPACGVETPSSHPLSIFVYRRKLLSSDGIALSMIKFELGAIGASVLVENRVVWGRGWEDVVVAGVMDCVGEKCDLFLIYNDEGIDRFKPPMEATIFFFE